MKRLVDLVDLEENNKDCVIFSVKEGSDMDLIKLWCFDGNETMLRMTKEEEPTYTVFRKDDKPYSFGELTLVTDKLKKQKLLISECAKLDFAIIMENRSSCRITDSLGERNPETVERRLFLSGWPDNHLNVRVNNQFVYNINFNELDEWLIDKGYVAEIPNEWGRSLQTGCYVNEGFLKRSDKEKNLKRKQDGVELNVNGEKVFLSSEVIAAVREYERLEDAKNIIENLGYSPDDFTTEELDNFIDEVENAYYSDTGTVESEIFRRMFAERFEKGSFLCENCDCDIEEYGILISVELEIDSETVNENLPEAVYIDEIDEIDDIVEAFVRDYEQEHDVTVLSSSWGVFCPECLSELDLSDLMHETLEEQLDGIELSKKIESAQDISGDVNNDKGASKREEQLL